MITIDDPFAHVLPNVHEGIRKSGLMRALHERLAELPPGAFPFASEFERLRNVVAPQIGEPESCFRSSLHITKSTTSSSCFNWRTVYLAILIRN
jgi:hypothetical protein